MINMMMIMMFNFYNNEMHVLYHKMFLFSSVMRAINLHIIVTKKNMKKVPNQLKEILYLMFFFV
jgi:hypothetical protein